MQCILTNWFHMKALTHSFIRLLHEEQCHPQAPCLIQVGLGRVCRQQGRLRSKACHPAGMPKNATLSCVPDGCADPWLQGHERQGAHSATAPQPPPAVKGSGT